MDFRTPQKQDMRFFYVLPVSERRALVEYVLLGRGNCNQALRDYIEGVLGIKQYQIVYREGGVTPLSDKPFRRQTGQHIMTIGIQGGRAKPSSGYVFSRIQTDSSAIVCSLLTTGHPFDIPSTPLPYRLCDSMMLQIMARHGERIRPLFTFLFKRNPVERIFKFLDEVTSLWEVFLLGISLAIPVMAARFAPSSAPVNDLKPALRQSSH
jgi:lycopene beta-cyclase